MVRQGNGTLLRLGAVCLLTLGLISAAGCSKAVGKVTGTVKFKNGTAVPAGTVVAFWTNDKRMFPGSVGADGTYSVVDVPAGEVTATVSPPVGQPPPAGQSPPAKPKDGKPAVIPPIPPKYKDQASSTLKYTIQKGENRIDITIE
jgi:hypothetical protein